MIYADGQILASESEIIKAYADVDLVIDWSRQETFDRCHREAWFSYELGWMPGELGWMPGGKPSDPLDFGKRLADALENNDEEAFAGYKEVGAYPKDNRTAGKGRELLWLYQAKFMKRDLEQYAVVRNEFPFGIIVKRDGKTLLIKGRIDQLLRDKTTGLYWIKEYKHSAAYFKNIDDYFKPYFLGGQTAYYMWAVNEIFGGDSVGGVIVDLFRVTKKVTDDSDFVRKVIEAHEIEWDGFEEVAREWLMAREYGFHRNVKSCSRYNSICPFYNVCARGYNNEDAFLREGLIKKGATEWHR